MCQRYVWNVATRYTSVRDVLLVLISRIAAPNLLLQDHMTDEEADWEQQRENADEDFAEEEEPLTEEDYAHGLGYASEDDVELGHDGVERYKSHSVSSLLERAELRAGESREFVEQPGGPAKL